eukprot:845249_1
MESVEQRVSERDGTVDSSVVEKYDSISKARFSDQSPDVGCGPGLASKEMLPFLTSDAELVCTDLSEDALAMASTVVKRLEGGALVSMKEANSEDLPFPENHFDRYIANFCLNLTSDPDKMLAECRRVLKDDGIAAFSVWGPPENGEFFTIAEYVLSKFKPPSTADSPAPPARSNFHLSDPVALRARVQRAGFDTVVAWRQTVPCPAISGREYAAMKMKMPSFRNVASHFDLPKLSEFQKKLEDAADQILSEGRPISFEAICVVASA